MTRAPTHVGTTPNLSIQCQKGLAHPRKRRRWNVFLTPQTGSGNVGSMTKKRLALFAILPLTIAVTLGVLAMLPPCAGVTRASLQLNRCPRNDFQQELFAPAATAAFHHGALLLVRVLFQEGQCEPIQPRKVLTHVRFSYA